MCNVQECGESPRIWNRFRVQQKLCYHAYKHQWLIYVYVKWFRAAVNTDIFVRVLVMIVRFVFSVVGFPIVLSFFIWLKLNTCTYTHTHIPIGISMECARMCDMVEICVYMCRPFWYWKIERKGANEKERIRGWERINELAFKNSIQNWDRLCGISTSILRKNNIDGIYEHM